MNESTLLSNSQSHLLGESDVSIPTKTHLGARHKPAEMVHMTAVSLTVLYHVQEVVMTHSAAATGRKEGGKISKTNAKG